MKICIHHRPNSFSETWIKYCIANSLDYELVDCYDTDIIKKVRGCDALLWHFHESDWKEVAFARSILFGIEQMGIRVFPNMSTAWHYDNKVSQKYLLEAVGAPLVPTYVFYDRQEALQWSNNAEFPKVFKLKGGAGSSNVILVKNRRSAEKCINIAFTKGFSIFNRTAHLKERIRRVTTGQESFLGILKGITRLFISTPAARNSPRERHYIYFQDFIPDNTFDTRIVVVNDKAIGERRTVRENDFRASGSGDFHFDGIDIEMVRIAFDTAKRLKLQSAAFDFISREGKPLIVEVSYAFGTKGILNAPGYWTHNLNFVRATVDPRVWIIQDLIESVQKL